MTTVLSLSDRATLSELEEVIERGLETFVDVGRALARIHDEDLYGDETFEAYLIRRWDMSWSRARQLMQGAKVADTTVSSGGIAPTTERQARALAPLKDSPKRGAGEATESPEADRRARQQTHRVASQDGRASAVIKRDPWSMKRLFLLCALVCLFAFGDVAGFGGASIFGSYLLDLR